MTDERRTLVLAPHLDDEVLGCFSFLGPNTHVLYCDLQNGPGSDAAVRMEELESVVAQTKHEWGLLDGGVESYRESDLVAAFESAINRQQAHRLLVPADSYHHHHRLVHEAGIAAARPHDRNHRPVEVLLYEQPQVVLWPTKPFHPNAFRTVDIERKIEAYRRYASQIRGHRSEEIIRAMAALRGAQAGVAAAEGFVLVRGAV